MNLAGTSLQYLNYLDNWAENLPTLAKEDILTHPTQTAIVCVDMINGFVKEGPLASERNRAIVPAIVQLFTLTYAAGVRAYILPQDSHWSDSQEFKCYPAHCVEGTSEADTISELAEIENGNQYVVLPKNSINTHTDYHLGSRLKHYKNIIVVGDCTDLCVYHLAMGFVFYSISHNSEKEQNIIVPASCVATYDLPTEVAKEIGAQPHPAELRHWMALHDMATNGVKVVKEIEW